MANNRAVMGFVARRAEDSAPYPCRRIEMSFGNQSKTSPNANEEFASWRA